MTNTIEATYNDAPGTTVRKVAITSSDYAIKRTNTGTSVVFEDILSSI